MIIFDLIKSDSQKIDRLPINDLLYTLIIYC